MLRISENNEIALTRGDTAYLKVPIINSDTGEEYVMASGDTETLTVKRTIKDEHICFQKTVTGTNSFHIEPEDTKDCDFANYKYDVQLVLVNGDVYTVVEPACFKILEEVTC